MKTSGHILKLFRFLLLLGILVSIAHGEFKKEQAVFLGVKKEFPEGMGVKLGYDFTGTLPFMVKESSLMKGNNLKIIGEVGLVPVGASGKVSLAVTPIAFFVLTGGTYIGVGWELGDFHGLVLNSENGVIRESLNGVLFEGDVSGKFQIETKGFLKKIPNIQVVSVTQLKYRKYTSATSDTPWIYENDSGENMNGLLLNFTHYLGLEKKLTEKLTLRSGVLLQTSEHITHRDDSPMDSENGWGSDFRNVLFGPLASLIWKNGFSGLILFEMRKVRVSTDKTKDEPFFKKRVYKESKIEAYRVQMKVTKEF